MTTKTPTFWSAAVDRTRPLDFASVNLMLIPEGATEDPSWWAGKVFDLHHMAPWVTALFAVREAAVGLVGIARGTSDVFRVTEVVGGEALIERKEGHLDFRVGVAVTEGLLRVTTAVTLHGWRGHLYWAFTKLFHESVTESMMRRAIEAAERDLQGSVV